MIISASETLREGWKRSSFFVPKTELNFFYKGFWHKKKRE